MTYFRVDDGFYDHPKVRSIPRGNTRKGAISLWTTAGSYICKYLLNGQISSDEIQDLGYTLNDARVLVAADLWHDHDHECLECPDVPKGHYIYHQWSEHNYLKEQVLANREAAKKRQQRRRHTEETNEVTP